MKLFFDVKSLLSITVATMSLVSCSGQNMPGSNKTGGASELNSTRWEMIQPALIRAGRGNMSIGPVLESELNNPKNLNKRLKVNLTFISVDGSHKKADHQLAVNEINSLINELVKGEKRPTIKLAGDTYFDALATSLYLIKGTSKQVRSLLLNLDAAVRLTDATLVDEVTVGTNAQ